MALTSCSVHRLPPFRGQYLRILLLVVAWLAAPGPFCRHCRSTCEQVAAVGHRRKKLVVERDRLWKESEDLQTQQKLSEAIAAVETTLAIDRRLFGNVHRRTHWTAGSALGLHVDLGL